MLKKVMLFSLAGGAVHVLSSITAAFLIILSLSPCIPSILLLTPGINVLAVAAVYGISTLITILTLTSLTTRTFRPPKVFHGTGEFFTGIVIAIP